MPLPRYGVAIGNLDRVFRDSPDQFGRWYHGHIDISTPSGIWTSALDVDTPTGVGVSYRISTNLHPDILGPVSSLPLGFHLLPSNASSGAIDYVRSEFLQDRLLWWSFGPALGAPRRIQPLPPPLPPGSPPRPQPKLGWAGRLQEQLFRVAAWPSAHRLIRPLYRMRPWIRSDGNNALLALEAVLVGTPKVYLFGDRFGASDQGVHDVHQNQGDPAGSQWWDLNGIWQDGAVAVERPDGTLFVWQVRFNSQSPRTKASGHPI
jgi:hypothetical protein